MALLKIQPVKHKQPSRRGCMSLLNTHRLSKCPLNRHAGNTDLWEMWPSNEF